MRSDRPHRREPRSGRPAGTRPPVRPRSVWILSTLLLFFGSLGVLVNAARLGDGVSYGDEDLLVLPAIGLIVTIGQIGSAALIFAGGVRWAPAAAQTICGINAISVVIGMLNGSGIGGVVGLLVNFALAVALADDDLQNWCRRS